MEGPYEKLTRSGAFFLPRTQHTRNEGSVP